MKLKCNAVHVAAQWLLVHKDRPLQDIVADLQRGPPNLSTAGITARIRQKHKLLALEIGRDVMQIDMLAQKVHRRGMDSIVTREADQQIKEIKTALIKELLPPAWKYKILYGDTPYYINRNNGTIHSKAPAPVQNILSEFFEGRLMPRTMARRRVDGSQSEIGLLGDAEVDYGYTFTGLKVSGSAVGGNCPASNVILAQTLQDDMNGALITLLQIVLPCY